MNKKIVILALLAMFIFPSLAGARGNASITLYPADGKYEVGEAFQVSISLNPNGEKIDTVRTKLSFQPEFLEIKSFSIDPKFSYQAGSNSYDNQAGTFSWGAGTPGGVTSASVFGTITFEAKQKGEAKITLEQDSLALSSGEDKFNSQTSSSTLIFSPKGVIAPVDQKTVPVKTVVQNTEKPEEANGEIDAEPIVSVSNQENPIGNKIITKPMPQSFLASMIGGITIGTALRLLAIILTVLSIFGIAMLLYRASRNKSQL